jgi:hypothetical protein
VEGTKAQFSLLILTENHALQARASVTIWARTGFSSVFLFLVDAIMDVAQMMSGYTLEALNREI